MNTTSQPVRGHCYSVEIRFIGDRLDPIAISRRIGLEPTNLMAHSTIRSTGRRRRPFWSYNGQNEAGFRTEWESLEEGLEFLLQQLTPFRPKIVELSKEFEGIWWCGHFQAAFDGGPSLTPKLLADLATFEIPLFIDNYFSDQAM